MGNAPGSEEARGAPKPCSDNEHEADSFSYCSEKWQTFAPESLFSDHSEQGKDLADWKTDGGKPEKEGGRFFTPRIDGAGPSPDSVTCLGSQQRPENARDTAQRADFAPGDAAVDVDPTRMPAMSAGEEMEHGFQEKMDTGHLSPALRLMKKQHGADSRESFVENNDSAGSGKDESVPPGDADQSLRIGECALYVCKCLERFVLPRDS